MDACIVHYQHGSWAWKGIAVRNNILFEKLHKQITVKRPMNYLPIQESIIRIKRKNTPFLRPRQTAGKPSWYSFSCAAISPMHCMFIQGSLIHIHQLFEAPLSEPNKPLITKVLRALSSNSLQLESSVEVNQRNHLFARYFVILKDPADGRQGNINIKALGDKIHHFGAIYKRLLFNKRN